MNEENQTGIESWQPNYYKGKCVSSEGPDGKIYWYKRTDIGVSDSFCSEQDLAQNIYNLGNETQTGTQRIADSIQNEVNGIIDEAAGCLPEAIFAAGVIGVTAYQVKKIIQRYREGSE